MTQKIITVFLVITGVVLIGIARAGISPVDFTTSAKSVGDLTVTWQTSPLFYVVNLLPGDTTPSKTITISNGSPSPIPLGLRGIITTPPTDPAFTDQLILTVTQNSAPVWSGSLTQFFHTPGFVNFGLLPSRATATYQFQVRFSSAADSRYQNDLVVFSLSVGYGVDIPELCRRIAARPDVEYIFGTGKNANITGTNHPDIIFGLDGNYKIEGGNADDCIVVGNGNNRIHGNNGNDIIIAGNNDIYGNNGNDYISVSTGTNRIDGGNGTNTCLSAAPSRTTFLHCSPKK